MMCITYEQSHTLDEVIVLSIHLHCLQKPLPLKVCLLNIVCLVKFPTVKANLGLFYSIKATLQRGLINVRWTILINRSITSINLIFWWCWLSTHQYIFCHIFIPNVQPPNPVSLAYVILDINSAAASTSSNSGINIDVSTSNWWWRRHIPLGSPIDDHKEFSLLKM